MLSITLRRGRTWIKETAEELAPPWPKLGGLKVLLTEWEFNFIKAIKLINQSLTLKIAVSHRKTPDLAPSLSHELQRFAIRCNRMSCLSWMGQHIYVIILKGRHCWQVVVAVHYFEVDSRKKASHYMKEPSDPTCTSNISKTSRCFCWRYFGNRSL